MNQNFRQLIQSCCPFLLSLVILYSLSMSVRCQARPLSVNHPQWHCLCYKERYQGSVVDATACQKSARACDQLELRVKEGSKKIIPNSLSHACTVVSSIHLKEQREGVQWLPSSKPEAIWTPSGCYLPHVQNVAGEELNGYFEAQNGPVLALKDVRVDYGFWGEDYWGGPSISYSPNHRFIAVSTDHDQNIIASLDQGVLLGRVDSDSDHVIPLNDGEHVMIASNLSGTQGVLSKIRIKDNQVVERFKSTGEISTFTISADGKNMAWAFLHRVEEAEESYIWVEQWDLVNHRRAWKTKVIAPDGINSAPASSSDINLTLRFSPESKILLLYIDWSWDVGCGGGDEGFSWAVMSTSSGVLRYLFGDRIYKLYSADSILSADQTHIDFQTPNFTIHWSFTWTTQQAMHHHRQLLKECYHAMRHGMTPEERAEEGKTDRVLFSEPDEDNRKGGLKQVDCQKDVNNPECEWRCNLEDIEVPLASVGSMLQDPIAQLINKGEEQVDFDLTNNGEHRVALTDRGIYLWSITKGEFVKRWPLPTSLPKDRKKWRGWWAPDAVHILFNHNTHWMLWSRVSESSIKCWQEDSKDIKYQFSEVGSHIIEVHRNGSIKFWSLDTFKAESRCSFP